jgi:hypothetical protein
MLLDSAFLSSNKLLLKFIGYYLMILETTPAPTV